MCHYILDDGWIFAHEAGHCLGGMHVRSKGKKILHVIFIFVNRILYNFFEVSSLYLFFYNN